MSLLTLPLRDEHAELLPHIESLRAAADMVGEAPVEALRQHIDAAYEFLAHHLLPHAQAEERALYPVVARVIGAPEATATMSRDHVEIARLTEELGAQRERLTGSAISASEARALRRILYGLYSMVKLHFAKEEEVYLPLLDDQLTAGEATAMFEAMVHAAHEAKDAASR
jgi:hemerythrin-like domain-containing protein